MYNRKFDIKKDFQELNEMENVILPQVKNENVKNYIRKIFINQWKESK
jgi:hypothetical protein